MSSSACSILAMMRRCVGCGICTRRSESERYSRTQEYCIPKPVLYGTNSFLDARDIAVMKIVAMSQRGRKRDFLDLYWHATHKEPLIDVIRRLPDQFPTVAHDYHHILKSMLYFDDAEHDPMPHLHFKTDWKTIKQYFKKEVPKITKELVGLTDQS